MKDNTDYRFGASLRAVLMVGLLLGSTIPVLQAASKAESLFQDAMIKESGERDPETAIRLYQQVVDQAGQDRLLASKARLRMGSCYEQLGKRQEAKVLYQQIVTETATGVQEIAQAARANLDRLEAADRKEQAVNLAAPATSQIYYENQMKWTRASLAVGPAFIVSKGDSLLKPSVSLRYRVLPVESTPTRPSIFVEAGAIPPVGGSQIQEQTKSPDAQTSDTASLSLNYQAYLALIGELPHGRQRNVIPEIGAGVALVSTKVEYASAYSGIIYNPAPPPADYPYPYSVETSQTDSQQKVSPYLSAGLRFFPDRIFSLVLQSHYIALPYSSSYSVPPQPIMTLGETTYYTPARSQSFHFPASAWAVAAKLQLKIGYSEWVQKERPANAAMTATGLSAVALSSPPPETRKNSLSMYIGPTVSWLTIGGDFDGEHALVQQETGDAFIVPKLDSSAGFGVVGGLRNRLHGRNLDMAVELSYEQGSMNPKSTLHEFGLTSKSYFLPQKTIQPFLAAGVDFPWLTVRDGMWSVPSYQAQDETFRGIGFHGGGGVCYFPWPQLSLEASVAYRYRHFTSVNGINLGDMDRNSGSFEPTLSIRYHFLGKGPSKRDPRGILQ